MRKSILAAVVTLATATAPAIAMPQMSAGPVDTGITTVSGGCGIYGHRGPYGGCRPNFQRPVYRGCPYGFHFGVYRRCVPNF